MLFIFIFINIMFASVLFTCRLLTIAFYCLLLGNEVQILGIVCVMKQKQECQNRIYNVQGN